MAPRNNLIGQKFGQLTVIAYDEQKSKEKKRTYWICECDCSDHTHLSVLSSNLISGNSTKCKYCKAENLVGKKFNSLTVIKRIIDQNDHVQWLCQCDCGNTKIIRRDSLLTGHTKSCGCNQLNFIKNLNAKDLIGEKFGKLTVIKRSERKNSSGQYYWFCDCDCGTSNIEIDGHNLISRGTQSCGCILSKGEEKIATILTENNIPFQREYTILDYTFKDSKGHPRFDFAIFNEDKSIKYFIEYQGEQHFFSRGKIFTPEKVSQIQQRDKEKLDYCNINNIPIIYIPYTIFNDITINDLIIGE